MGISLTLLNFNLSGAENAVDVQQIHILQFQFDEITQFARPAIYNEIAKLDNLKVLLDIKNLVDSKIRAKETAHV